MVWHASIVTFREVSFRPSAKALMCHFISFKCMSMHIYIWLVCSTYKGNLILRNKDVHSTRGKLKRWKWGQVCRFVAESAAHVQISSVGERRHKPASLWSPTQHMKNETQHCQLIHLYKSLNWDVNLKVQWERNGRRINTEASGRRAENATHKCPYFIV